MTKAGPQGLVLVHLWAALYAMLHTACLVRRIFKVGYDGYDELPQRRTQMGWSGP